MSGRPVIALRPEPGLSATRALARSMDLTVIGAPLAQVVPVAWQAPEREAFDALLLGSANALRMAGPAIDRWRGSPALVVGETTGRAAREAGLAVVATGSGGLQAVLDQAAQHGRYRRLLRLAGESHIALEPPAGVVIETRVVYRLVYGPLVPELVAALADGQGGAVILLHSADAARHLAAECERLGLDRARLTLAALAPRIAAAAGQGWGRVAVAAHPCDRAVLELARELCHGHGGALTSSGSQDG